MLSRPWRRPWSTTNGITRPMPCASSATSLHGTSLQRSRRPPPTTSRPSPWLRSLVCARSSALPPGPRHAVHVTGQQEHARTELSTAIELYRAMGMTFWLPQAQAALARVEGDNRGKRSLTLVA